MASAGYTVAAASAGGYTDVLKSGVGPGHMNMGPLLVICLVSLLLTTVC